MAEMAILRHSGSGRWHGACDDRYYGNRPHQCTPPQSRVGLFITCRLSCLLLELALCSDCNSAPTLLCLLLFHPAGQYLKTSKYRDSNTACNTCCGHRICAVNSATCACTSAYGRARSRAFNGLESHWHGSDERIRRGKVAAPDS